MLRGLLLLLLRLLVRLTLLLLSRPPALMLLLAGLPCCWSPEPESGCCLESFAPLMVAQAVSPAA